MVSTDSLVIGGAGVVAAVILTQSGSSSGSSSGQSNTDMTGPTPSLENTQTAIRRFEQGELSLEQVQGVIDAFEGGGSTGGSQRTLPEDFRGFDPQVKAEIRKLPQEQINMLPTSDDPPLSGADLDVLLGEGTVFGDPNVIPDSDPVEVVRNAFRNRAGLEL